MYCSSARAPIYGPEVRIEHRLEAHEKAVVGVYTRYTILMNTSGPSSSCRAYSPTPSRGRGTLAGRQQERIIPMEATTRAAIGGQCVGCSEPATATSFCCSKCKRNYRDSFNLLRVYNNETIVYDTDHINGFLRTVLGKNVRNKFYHCQRVDYNNGQYHQHFFCLA